MRAASLLWHVPQTQRQLEDILTAVEGYTTLPDTLTKLNATETLLRQSLENNQQSDAQDLLEDAHQLASRLDATAVLIRLYLLEANTFSSPQAVAQLLNLSPAQFSLKEQLPVLQLDIDRATAAQAWQPAAEKLTQAVALNAELARNNALAREYAGFQLVEQARSLSRHASNPAYRHWQLSSKTSSDSSICWLWYQPFWHWQYSPYCLLKNARQPCILKNSLIPTA